MTTYFVPEAELARLLSEPSGYSVFAPVETGRLTWLDSVDSAVSLEVLSQPRPAQSPKGLFLPATESVGRYGGDASAAAAVATEAPDVLLVGVRACELRARNYLDKVMLEGDFDDPSYSRRREQTAIVSCDCVDCTETCCCTLVGGRPFATEGYDLNLTPIDGGFVVEVATEKGEALLGEAKPAEATADQLARRDELRKEMTGRVGENNAQFAFRADDSGCVKLPEGEDDAWQQFAADCVECGACTNICPTCHCFYLYDQVLGKEDFERVRTWDSCLFATYHRMAGGVNMKLTPRPELSSRLANRVLHKFTYSPQQYELLGCVGCGRCIDACLGAIDIREVVEELSK